MLLRDGKPLWQHQCQSLELAGAAEILISGRNDGPWVHEYRVVADRFPGQGPLGGIAAVLEAAQFDRVLVLAVDLPRMQPNFLRKLMEAGCVVPEHDGWFEPLAAVYPKSAAAMAERHLLEGKRSMQDFVRELIRTGQVQSYPLDSCDLALFENINTPDDYQRLNS